MKFKWENLTFFGVIKRESALTANVVSLNFQAPRPPPRLEALLHHVRVPPRDLRRRRAGRGRLQKGGGKEEQPDLVQGEG